jgi:hypothetical protein
MSEVLFKAHCNRGNIKFYAEDYVQHHLDKYNNTDVYVSVKPYKPKRSIRQNNWYYGVAIPMIQAFILETQGEKYSKEEINQYHLNTVVKPVIEVKAILQTPCTIYKIKRTSEMNTVEFMEFKEKIQMYWAKMDLIIPDPDQKEFT